MTEHESDPERRDSPRIEHPETLEVVVPSFGKFLEQHADNISTGGMFLRSAAPPPPGTRVRFAIRLEDGYSLLNGEGEVVWRREHAEGRGRPAGMGLRFLELDKRAGLLVEQIVEERAAATSSSEPGVAEPTEEAESRPQESEATVEPQVVETVADAPPERDDVPPAAQPGHAAPDGEPVEIAQPDERSGAEEDPLPESSPPFEPTLLLEPAADEDGTVDDPTAGEVDLGHEDGSLDDIGRPLSFEEQPEAPRRWIRPVVLMVAVSAALIAVVGLVRLLAVREERGGAERRPSPTATSAAAARSSTTETVGAGSAGGTTDTASTERGPEAAEPPTEPTPLPEPTGVPRAESPQPPARAVSAMTWRRDERGTTIRIEPRGSLSRERVKLSPLADPPRALVRLLGVTERFEPTEIDVGTAEVSRVRVWLHDELEPSQLYVVVDLASPRVRTAVAVEGDAVIVTASR